MAYTKLLLFVSVMVSCYCFNIEKVMQMSRHKDVFTAEEKVGDFRVSFSNAADGKMNLSQIHMELCIHALKGGLIETNVGRNSKDEFILRELGKEVSSVKTFYQRAATIRGEISEKAFKNYKEAQLKAFGKGLQMLGKQLRSNSADFLERHIS